MAYIFDPDTLQEICRKNLNLPLEEKIEAITDELERRYPNRIQRRKRWVFSVSAGSVVMMTIMYASLTEYLILFGSAIGSEGYTGRYRWCNIYDIIVDGEMWCYSRGQFERAVYKQGDMAYLTKGLDKGYRMRDHCWILRYCKGFTLPVLLFGALTSFMHTMDFKSTHRQIWDYSRLCVRELLRGKI